MSGCVKYIIAEQFNKLIAIQVKSKDAIKFVPQSTNQFGVTTQAFVSQVQIINKEGKNVQEQIYTNVWLEWTDEAAPFAREIFDMFIKTDQAQVQKAG